MANVGRLLVRGLGAAMAGYGNGMLQQEAIAQKQRESDALAAREAALIELRHQRGEQSAEAQVGRNARDYANRGAVEVGTFAARQKVEEPYRVADDARRTAAQAKADERRLVLELLASQGKSDIEIATELKKRGLQLGEYAPKPDKPDRPRRIDTVEVSPGNYEAVMSDGSRIPLGGTPVAVKKKEAGAGAALPPRGGGGEGLPDTSAYLGGAAEALRSQRSPTGGADGAPVPGARRAPDGNWYVQRGNQWFKVQQ